MPLAITPMDPHAGVVTENPPQYTPPPGAPETAPQARPPYPPAGSPPLGGFPPAAPVEVEPPEGWRAAYLKARQRSNIFMIATIGLAITTLFAGMLALGFGAWGLTNSWGSGGTRGQGPMQGDRGPYAGREPGQARGQQLAQRFFNPDGSLNQAQVDRLKARIARGDGPDSTQLKALLDRAVAAGTITPQQAASLIAAVGAGTPTPSPTTTKATPTPTAVP